MRCQRCGQHSAQGVCDQCTMEGGVPGMTRIREALAILPYCEFTVTGAQDILGYYYNYTLRLLRYLKRSGLVEQEMDKFMVTMEGDKLRRYESVEKTTKKVLEVLGTNKDGFTVKEVGSRIGRPNGVAYNILRALMDDGKVQVRKEEQKGTPKVNVYYLSEKETGDEDMIPAEGSQPGDEIIVERENQEDTGIGIENPKKNNTKPELPVKCNCTGRWHTLKNRLIQAGELEALKVMVEIEESK